MTEVEVVELESPAWEELGCATPGKKIRSKGKGRGRARGAGRGPIGVPYKAK